MKACRRCHETKVFTDFYKAKDTSDGHKGFCKACIKEIDLDREEKHKIERYKYFLEQRGYKVKKIAGDQ